MMTYQLVKKELSENAALRNIVLFTMALTLASESIIQIYNIHIMNIEFDLV